MLKCYTPESLVSPFHLEILPSQEVQRFQVYLQLIKTRSRRRKLLFVIFIVAKGMDIMKDFKYFKLLQPPYAYLRHRRAPFDLLFLVLHFSHYLQAIQGLIITKSVIFQTYSKRMYCTNNEINLEITKISSNCETLFLTSQSYITMHFY